VGLAGYHALRKIESGMANKKAGLLGAVRGPGERQSWVMSKVRRRTLGVRREKKWKSARV